MEYSHLEFVSYVWGKDINYPQIMNQYFQNQLIKTLSSTDTFNIFWTCFYSF